MNAVVANKQKQTPWPLVRKRTIPPEPMVTNTVSNQFWTAAL
jgi:hypothetical protein